MNHMFEIIHHGQCIVMGIGVTPDRFKQYITNPEDQDYLVVGLRYSPVAHMVATKIGNTPPVDRSITIAEVELDVYLDKI